MTREMPFFSDSIHFGRRSTGGDQSGAFGNLLQSSAAQSWLAFRVPGRSAFGGVLRRRLQRRKDVAGAGGCGQSGAPVRPARFQRGAHRLGFGADQNDASRPKDRSDQTAAAVPMALRPTQPERVLLPGLGPAGPVRRHRAASLLHRCEDRRSIMDPSPIESYSFS